MRMYQSSCGLGKMLITLRLLLALFAFGASSEMQGRQAQLSTGGSWAMRREETQQSRSARGSTKLKTRERAVPQDAAADNFQSRAEAAALASAKAKVEASKAANQTLIAAKAAEVAASRAHSVAIQDSMIAAAKALDAEAKNKEAAKAAHAVVNVSPGVQGYKIRP